MNVAYEVRISDWSSDVCSSDLKRRETHYIAGDLQHQFGESFGAAHQRPALFAERGQSDAGEEREDENLEDVVLRHRRDDVLRENMFNELEHIELLPLASQLCRGSHVDPAPGRSETRREGERVCRTCR